MADDTTPPKAQEPMDLLKQDKIHWDKKPVQWSNFILAPERTVKDYEKVLGFRSKQDAESVLRVLHIFMYGSTTIGEESHMEVYARYSMHI